MAGDAGGAVVAGDAVNEAEERRDEEVCRVEGFRRSLCLLSLRMMSGMRSGLTSSTMQHPFAMSTWVPSSYRRPCSVITLRRAAVTSSARSIPTVLRPSTTSSLYDKSEGITGIE